MMLCGCSVLILLSLWNLSNSIPTDHRTLCRKIEDAQKISVLLQAEPGSELSSHSVRSATMKFICGAVAVSKFCYLCETVLTVLPLIARLHPGKSNNIRIYWDVIMLLFMVNSAINPVVYALFKSDIKRSLRRMLHRNRWYWPGPNMSHEYIEDEQ